MIILWVLIVLLIIAAVVPNAEQRAIYRLWESIYEDGIRHQKENEKAILAYVRDNLDEVIATLQLRGFVDIPYPGGVFTYRHDPPA